MSKELASWFEKKAGELGVSVSGYMVMSMQQYKQQLEGLELAKSGFPEMIRQIKEMQENDK